MLEDNYPSKEWKYCPYCGSTQLEWDWTRKMVCKTCSRQFYINASTAVVAIIENPKGELLLTRRAKDPVKGTLDLPGGFVNILERVEDAIKREVKEELNLTIESLQFLGTYPNRYLYGGIVYFTTDVVFVCKVSDFSKMTAADDVDAYVFLSPEDVDPQKVGLESIRKVVDDYCKARLTAN